MTKCEEFCFGFLTVVQNLLVLFPSLQFHSHDVEVDTKRYLLSPCPDTESVSHIISINVTFERLHLFTNVLILYNLILTADSLTCSLCMFTMASLTCRQFCVKLIFHLSVILSPSFSVSAFLTDIEQKTKEPSLRKYYIGIFKIS